MLPSRENANGEKRCRPSWYVLFVLFLAPLLPAAGCSLLPPQHKDLPSESAGLKALDEHAWICYERGLAYMDQSRYELARQQFSFAASSAVSRTLYEDALDGIHRAEQIIRQQR